MQSNDVSTVGQGSDSPAAVEQVLASGAIVLEAYRVERQIGEGGFGRVYEAIHLPSAARVALKIGRRLEHGERLLREARLAAMLESPHAVRVLTVEHFDDGRPVIVLEFLEGMSLRDYLKQECRVPSALAVSWALQLLEVLQEAHHRGLIHRDIKPSNLFLVERADGTKALKLLDFGLARASHAASEASVTGSDLVVGSPAYMSPEQIRGDAVTIQSDIWAFGIVLYEMLAGERPFRGETNAAVVASIVADPPLPWTEGQQALELGLGRIVAQCLRKNLDDRARSADEVARSLRVLLGNPNLAADETATSTLSIAAPHLPMGGAVVRRSPLSARTAAIAVILAIALVGWTRWSRAPGFAGGLTQSMSRSEDSGGVEKGQDLERSRGEPRVIEVVPPSDVDEEVPDHTVSLAAPRATVSAVTRSGPPSRAAPVRSQSSEKAARFFAEPDF